LWYSGWLNTPSENDEGRTHSSRSIQNVRGSSINFNFTSRCEVGGLDTVVRLYYLRTKNPEPTSIALACSTHFNTVNQENRKQNGENSGSEHIVSCRRVNCISTPLRSRRMPVITSLPHVKKLLPLYQKLWMIHKTGLVESNISSNRRVCLIDYRCDNRRFWLSAHSCQVQTPTSENLNIEQQISIFGAD
jgi:hypothetical protein